jgi:hypothetical protein
MVLLSVVGIASPEEQVIYLQYFRCDAQDRVVVPPAPVVCQSVKRLGKKLVSL